MATLNMRRRSPVTHEGGKASIINPLQQLKRTVLTCMLWEDSFYEDGESVGDRIAKLVPLVEPQQAADVAIEAREKMKLRHAPLLVVREMARHKTHRPLVRATLARVIQRVDELTEFLTIYWKDGKCPIAKSVQKGLADAFRKFSEYDLAKYDREKAIKLKDVLFLSHAKPSKDQCDGRMAHVDAIDKANYRRGEVARHRNSLFAKLVEGTLETPDTWEVAISAAKTPDEKTAAWRRLIVDGKLGALALLRNLRNLQECGIEDRLVAEALGKVRVERVLPYRFIAAARYNPRIEPAIEAAMMKCVAGLDKLPGRTVLLIDVSGSMDDTMSNKSDLRRVDAACGLGVICRELCEDILMATFSNALAAVPPRHGFALRDAIVDSQPHGGTNVGAAVELINTHEKYDRIIVITDEQAHDTIPAHKARGYIINVAAYQNGIGYGAWRHINGFSEAVLAYIMESERQNQ